MHYHKDGQPFNFAILDWQLMTYSSPVFDLSYFLFTCLAKEDIDDFDSILHHYYKNLADHLEKLGSNSNLYPLNQFLEEWKKYSKFGVIMSTIIHKLSYYENNEVPDLTEAAEKGEDISKQFSKSVKNIGEYQDRMLYIVKHVVENNLI